MMRKLGPLIVALLSASVAHAEQCAEYIRLETPQIKELIKTMKDEGADPFDQIDALETLTCAERKLVRDQAFRAALTSPNDIIRSEAVFRALADRASIHLQLVKTEGMSAEQIQFVKENPVLIYDRVAVDVGARCVSLYAKTCTPKSSLIVTRNEVTLRYGKGSAVLKSSADGRLVGVYRKGKIEVPAEIEVY